MTRGTRVRGGLLVVATAMAVLVPLVVLTAAEAASDVQVTAVDCRSHPRRIAIKNLGDTAQDLTGWRLQSDQPDEVFDLTPVATLGAGATVYVFNGHQAPDAPVLVGGAWIYPWNPGSFDWALNEDGHDFIRIVDAARLPWRSVSEMPCPGTAEIPPLQQPTPTPPPSNPNPGSTEPGAPQDNQVDDTQSASTQAEDTQSSGAARNVAAANSALGGGAGTTAQTGNVSGQAAGGPASGAGLLSGSSGAPLAGHLLLSLLGVAASAVLALLGLRMLHRPQWRP